MKSLLASLLVVIMALGCNRGSNVEPLPDYITNLKFNCNSSTLSSHYGQAIVNGQGLCYSTNNAFYKNFAYKVSEITSGGNSASNNQTSVSESYVEVGVGGLGDSSTPPAPVFFYIDTPTIIGSKLDKNQLIEEMFQKGTSLDVSVSETEKQLLIATANKFKIGMFAQYLVNGNLTVNQFYTWTGVQDTTSYLKVSDVQSVGNAKVITVNFGCKLYDNHGHFFANVTNGELRFLSQP